MVKNAILDNGKKCLSKLSFLQKLFCLTKSLSVHKLLMVTIKIYLSKVHQHSQKNNIDWKQFFFFSLIKSLSRWILEILVAMNRRFFNYILHYAIIKKKHFKGAFKLGCIKVMDIASRFFFVFVSLESFARIFEQVTTNMTEPS